MTRIAPLLTLTAVVALGGGLLVTNYLSAPAEQPVVNAVPAASAGPAEAPAAPPTPPPAEPLDAPALPDAPADPPAEAQGDGYGAAGDEAPAPGEVVTYAGWTRGMDNTVAIAVDGEEAIAYVCDGGPFEVWFSGTFRDGELDLRSRDGGTFTGTVDDANVAGEVTVDGETWEFTAEVLDVEAAARAGRGDVREALERLETDG